MPIAIRGALSAGLLFCLLLASCASVTSRPQEQFHSANLDFLKRLRWHDYHGAAGHLSDEYREDFLERFLPLTDLHITDVRLDRIDVNPGGEGAMTRVVLEYYLLPSPTVKALPLRQEWVYSSSAGWRMVTPIPPLD